MDMPSSNDAQRANKSLRRTGIAGLILSALAIIACELPLLVALIGVGGSSASLAAFKPTAAVETAGIVAGAAAAMLLLATALRRSPNHVGNRNADR